MLRNFVRLAIASLVVSPAVARADDLVLDYPTTLRLAVERAPEAVAARGRIEEVRGLGAAAGVRPNPELGATAGPRVLDGRNRLDLEVSLAVPLELGGKRGARVAVAAAELAGATAAAAERDRVVRRDAGLAYVRALAAEQLVRIAADVEAVAAEIAAATARRLARGDALELDVALAKAALGRARSATRAAEADREAALGALRGLLALAPTDTIVLRGDLAERRTVELDALVDRAAQRPELVALDAEARAGAAQARAGASAGWPDVTVGVSYRREEDAQIILGGLTVTLPMFDRGQGDRRIGRARTARAGAERDARGRSIDAELRGAVAVYRTRLAAVDELATGVNPLLDDSDRMLTKAYDAGQLGLADYLVARRELLDARVEYVQRLREAAEAGVEVDAAAGVQP